MKTRVAPLAWALALATAWPAVHAGLDGGLAALRAKDYAAALREFRPLADKGDPVAEYSLGTLFDNGLGVTMDHAQAAAWYAKAAAQGHAKAQLEYGSALLSGLGVAADPAQAFVWLKRAADQGNGAALHNLGFLYERGQGVAADRAQALAYYRKAVEAGFAPSLYNLGVLVATDAPGAPGDPVLAYAVFSLAPPQDARSASYKEVVAGRMNAPQLRNARALAGRLRLGEPLPGP